MSSQINNLSDILFDNLGDYRNYLFQEGLHDLLNVDVNQSDILTQKAIKHHNYSVDPSLKEALSAEFDDLIRLHFLIRSRKVTTILEFGVGKSTKIFDDAINKNKNEFGDYIGNSLRRHNAFECHSVDNNLHWIENTKKTFSFKSVQFYHSKLVTSTFNDRVCTFFDPIPQICPDFIYLDGPDQWSSEGAIRGISTSHPDRLPMAADILSFEHFLLPGTLIVTDGRTANARFLLNNLQRNWNYCHDINHDQHYFELAEAPLGIYNKAQIDFCLGQSYYERIKN